MSLFRLQGWDGCSLHRIRLESLVLEFVSLTRADAPDTCTGLGTLAALYYRFWFCRPHRAPPAAQDESLQQPRPDPAEQCVWCLRSASGGHSGQHGLLAVHGGGDRFAAEPDHRGQDGAARWPLESLLLCRCLPCLPSLTPKSLSIVTYLGFHEPRSRFDLTSPLEVKFQHKPLTLTPLFPRH